MGCDIHAIKESKDLFWKNEGKPDIHRDYELFAVLAGVRNNHGIVPISEPKGFPNDTCSEFDSYYEDWGEDAHSASWLTLRELKEFDQDVYIDDQSHCIRGEDGKIEETHASCFGRNSSKCTDRVGHRKLFGIWERNPLNDLIAELEEIRKKRDLSDDNVRVVFFFDN